MAELTAFELLQLNTLGGSLQWLTARIGVDAAFGTSVVQSSKGRKDEKPVVAGLLKDNSVWADLQRTGA